jgi:hypothetical protein
MSEDFFGQPKVGNKNQPKVDTNDSMSVLRNVVDVSARHRVINHVISKEIVGDSDDWVASTRENLWHYGISISEDTIKRYVHGIRNDKRSAKTISMFGKKLPNKILCTSRSGKEIMYGQMDILVDMNLTIPHLYVGLPANQIIHMIQKYSGNVCACELDKNMFKFMSDLHEELTPNKYSSKVEINNCDILEYLYKTHRKFSIFDFDLMKNVNKSVLTDIARTVSRTMLDICVVCITSCMGRSQTEEKYMYTISKHMERLFNNKGCRFKMPSYSGKYIDKKVPMRYELIVLSKEK